MEVSEKKEKARKIDPQGKQTQDEVKTTPSCVQNILHPTTKTIPPLRHPGVGKPNITNTTTHTSLPNIINILPDRKNLPISDKPTYLPVTITSLANLKKIVRTHSQKDLNSHTLTVPKQTPLLIQKKNDIPLEANMPNP